MVNRNLKPSELVEFRYYASALCALDLSKTPNKPYRSFVSLLSGSDTNLTQDDTEELIYVNNVDPDIEFGVADTFVRITADKSTVAAGTEVIYIITFKNNGHGTARDVIIVDEFPKYLTLVKGYSESRALFSRALEGWGCRYVFWRSKTKNYC